MTKIRKQPRRSGKKQRVQSLRNPFFSQPLHCLPIGISQKLSKMQELIFGHIDDVVCQPEQYPQQNIELMKQALYQQELKISGLKCNGFLLNNLKIGFGKSQLEVNSRLDSNCDDQELDGIVEEHRLEWLQQSLDLF